LLGTICWEGRTERRKNTKSTKMSNIALLLLLVSVIGRISAKPNDSKITDMDKQMTAAASQNDAAKNDKTAKTVKEVLTEPAGGIKVKIIEDSDESQEDLDGQDDELQQKSAAVSDQELGEMVDKSLNKEADQVAQKDEELQKSEAVSDQELEEMVDKKVNSNKGPFAQKGEAASVEKDDEVKEKDDEVEAVEKRGKLNNYKANFAYACPNGRSLSTVWSSYHPILKDRQWSASCDKYLPRGYVGPRFWSTNNGYDNEYRGTINAYCPPQAIMTGLAGYYHGSYNDRRFKIFCTHVWHHKKIGCKWSPYINNWKESAHFTLSCNQHYYIAGIQGYFHTGFRDRRFRIYMCKLQKI